MTNPSDAGNAAALRNLQNAAKERGVRILPVEASTPEQIANGIVLAARQNDGALIVLRQSLFQQQQNQIVELAARQRLPSIGGYSEYAEAGGLMSYGQNIREIFRRAATYVDKIFKGANPGDIPVEQPTHFELFVNMKTAKALGVKVPQSILVQATKVIE